MDKKGKAKLNKGLLEAAVVFIVLIVLFLSIYAVLVPEAQTAGDSMNDSTLCQAIDSCVYNSTSLFTDNCQLNSTNNTQACGTAPTYIPLSTLFGGTGVIFTVIMAALLIVLIGGSLVAMKKGGK